MNDPAAQSCPACGAALPAAPSGPAAPSPEYPPQPAAYPYTGSGSPAPDTAQVYGYPPPAGSDGPAGGADPYSYVPGAQSPGAYPAQGSPYDYPGAAQPVSPGGPATAPPYPYAPGSPGQPPAAYGPAPAQPAPGWGAAAAPRRRGNTPLIALALGVPLLLCVCAVLVYAVAGPGIGPLFVPPSPTPPDAADVLTRAADRMGEVQTVHYRMLGEFTNVGSPGVLSLNLEGDIRFPDSYTMRSESSGDMIVIGSEAWLRGPDSQRWIQAEAAEAGSATTNPAALARFVRYHRSPIVESDYMSGTMRLYRINFTIDTLALAAGEGEGSAGETLLGTDADADVVISAGDSLLRELVLRISDTGESSAQIHIEFSNFDEPVTIAPPEDAGP